MNMPDYKIFFHLLIDILVMIFFTVFAMAGALIFGVRTSGPGMDNCFTSTALSIVETAFGLL
jgi:hypothetical protein